MDKDGENRHLRSVKDVANTVLFLASDESTYSTGAEFVMDGEATASQTNLSNVRWILT